MFYAIIDDAGMFIASGYNTTSKEDLKDELLSLLAPQIDSTKDFKAMKKMTADEICDIQGYSIEESETKFPDESFVFD